ncbi:unnamed protein product [Spirodela intermedia]|uniref:Uncharacterized protein n=1 Tax=Spirodela intermedia TaxID=51605 RepID=A0A7I8IPN3_SPIIN|nr:unnamed protein product [Spirodela intermedia]CAA6659760.1 unnamed protein product [Spirodela intermedia]
MISPNLERGAEVNNPRCLFRSTSLGQIAIITGGHDVNGNELYRADYAAKKLRKYGKESNKWIMLGSLGVYGGTIELNTWVPQDGPPE